MNEETHPRRVSRISTLDTCQINLLQVFIFMQRIKESTSPSVFSSYFKIINHVHETWFSKHTFKRTRWFFRYVKFLINYRGRKLENCRKKKYGRKNLVTTIFFEQRVKEKLNTWFDYYIWECWLLCVCVCLYSSTVKASSVCKMSKTYLRVRINDLVL